MMEEVSLVSGDNKRRFNPNTKKLIVFGAIFLIVAVAFTVTIVMVTRPKPPGPGEHIQHKSLIFMMGDGYGPASVTMGRTCKGSDLNIEKYLVGMTRTRSNESVVTDSAAAATTYSCGLRTYNAAIAVDVNEKPCGTVFEAARAKGMAIGAVVTSRVTHATPAAFTSHAVERDDEEFIAKQQLTAGLDVLMGGGRDMFDNATRSDGLNLIQQAKDQGYTVLKTLADFLSYTGNGPVLGLFAPSHMSYEIDRVRVANESSIDAQPSLAQMTEMAIKILSAKGGDNGFMLLVEGSRIDHAGHANDPAAHMRDVLSFDDAAEVVLNYAQSSQNTLVVATADHETGGVTLAYQPDVNEEYLYVWYPEVIKAVNASTEYMVELIEAGQDVKAVVQQYAIPDVTDAEVAYARSLSNGNSTLLLWALGKIVSDRALIGFTTHGHTGVDVNLYAYSPYQNDDLPRGSVENFNIGLYFAQEFGLDLAAITAKISNFNPRPN